MVGSLVLRLRFDPVLIRGLSRTPRLRPTVFRADLLRARPPPFDSFMVSSSAHSARQTTGAARLGHLPRCLPLVRPAPYLCVYSAPHPGLGGRWAQRSMVGAVSSARIRRPGRDAGVPVRSPRRTTGRKLPLSIHVRSGPFSSCCAALLAVAPLVMGSGRLPLGQGLDFSFPPSLLLLLGRLSARPPLFSLPDAPFSCPQLDAFSISLNVPSPVVRRTRPPDLACSWA